MITNFFLTGRPRRGKSTIIARFLPLIQGPAGGFFVQRLLMGGETRAFRLVDLLEEPYHLQQPLTGRISNLLIYQKKNSPHWTPVVSTFNLVGVRALQRAAHCPLLIMDELGIFEEKAVPFQKAVLDRLRSPQTVLGVLKNKQGRFLNNIRARDDLEIHRVDDPETENRLEFFLQQRGLLK